MTQMYILILTHTYAYISTQFFNTYLSTYNAKILIEAKVNHNKERLLTFGKTFVTVNFFAVAMSECLSFLLPANHSPEESS